MKRKYTCLFLTGFTVYPIIEIIFRGRTHYSMAIAGGVCVCLIDKICNEALAEKGIIRKCLCGGIIITAVEFIFGVVFNIILKMNVWNYSKLPLNILGQICLPFTLVWSVLSLPVIYVGKLFSKEISKERSELFKLRKIRH